MEEEIKARVERLESLVKKIIELPQLTNLAAKDTISFLARIKQMAAMSEEALNNPDITAQERKKHEEKLAIYRHLSLPTLHEVLDDNLPTEALHEQDNGAV